MIFYVMAAQTEMAQNYKHDIETFCNTTDDLKCATHIIILGGDGFMLKSMHTLADPKNHAHLTKPIYGINCGSVGFLMNTCERSDIPQLPDLISSSVETLLFPLIANARTSENQQISVRAINEITMLRHSNQTCHIQIAVNSIVRMEKLVGDGVLVATTAGSTAYNFSAGGPILPIGSNALALTPLNAYIPRRWPGAILDNNAVITLTVLNHEHRPVSLTADCLSIENVIHVDISEDKHNPFHMLFNRAHNLETRIAQQQFNQHANMR